MGPLDSQYGTKAGVYAVSVEPIVLGGAGLLAYVLFIPNIYMHAFYTYFVKDTFVEDTYG